MIRLFLADGLDGRVQMHQFRHVVCQEVVWRAKFCRGDSVGIDRGNGSDIVDLFRVA